MGSYCSQSKKNESFGTMVVALKQDTEHFACCCFALADVQEVKNTKGEWWSGRLDADALESVFCLPLNLLIFSMTRESSLIVGLLYFTIVVCILWVVMDEF
jgi:hypothetical protein